MTMRRKNPPPAEPLNIDFCRITLGEFAEGLDDAAVLKLYHQHEQLGGLTLAQFVRDQEAAHE